MIKFRLTAEGTAPLLMHNARLADPLDPIVKSMKKLTAKTRKTDEDHEKIARLEFLGGLYYDQHLGPYIPAANFFRCLRDAAKTRRMQPKVVQGIIFDSDDNPLAYDGPRDAEELAADKNFVHRWSAKVANQRVMRTRPVFRNWRVYADGLLDPAIIDLSDLKDVALIAGQRVGLGDWRPQYGRFVSTVEDITSQSGAGAPYA